MTVYLVKFLPKFHIYVHCMYSLGQNHIDIRCIYGISGSEITNDTVIHSVHTVYIRYFWQGNHQWYGQIRCIYCYVWYTILANPMLTPFQGKAAAPRGRGTRRSRSIVGGEAALVQQTDMLACIASAACTHFRAKLLPPEDVAQGAAEPLLVVKQPWFSRLTCLPASRVLLALISGQSCCPQRTWPRAPAATGLSRPPGIKASCPSSWRSCWELENGARASIVVHMREHMHLRCGRMFFLCAFGYVSV
jgi:hypothetical protein